jgi:NAD(P)-dependent dehydrogenase (short-subunit alcohol dehydrogenase family)
MKHFERALVIGASSGIGKALCEELLATGAAVAMVGRNVEAMNRIANTQKAFVYQHDVKHYDEVPALLQQITKDLGGLDLVIYNTGVLYKLDEHEYSFGKDRDVIETNVIGAFAWLDEVAKRFEQTKSGTIVGISSIAGDRGRRGNPAYGTSKAALTTFLEALRNRLSRFGVRVVTIKPGFIETEMTRGMQGLFWLIKPEEAAKEIISAARKGKSTRYVPWRWRIVATILKSIPSFIFRWLPV